MNFSVPDLSSKKPWAVNFDVINGNQELTNNMKTTEILCFINTKMLL